MEPVQTLMQVVREDLFDMAKAHGTGLVQQGT